MKTVFGKYIVLFVALQVFLGCKDILEPLKLKTGTGSFSLTINEPNTGRTILPQTVQNNFEEYKLEFFAAGRTTNPAISISRTNANLSNPVLLDVGIWDLYVTAYLKDQRGELKPAAQGKFLEIAIGGEETVNGGVTLEPAADSGRGTFSWSIDYPANVTSAKISITPLNEGWNYASYFVGGEPLVGKDHSLSLNAGYYSVVFELLNNQGGSAARREILHIYQNLESSFSFTFIDSHFLIEPLKAILAAWDGDDSRWYLHDTGITAAHFVVAGIDGVDDDNFDDVVDYFDNTNLPATDLSALKVLVDVALVDIVNGNEDFCAADQYADWAAAEKAIGLLVKNGTAIEIVKWEGYDTVHIQLDGQYPLLINFDGNIAPTLIGIRVATLPTKTEYLIGESLDLTGLQVNDVYADGLEKEREEKDYSVYQRAWVPYGSYAVNDIVTYDGRIFVCILANSGGTRPWPLTGVAAQRWVLLGASPIGDTFFRMGAFLIIVSASGDASKTAFFEITVSDQLIDTGLPVVYINTQNAQAITSKEDYINGTIMVRQSDSILYGEQTMRIRGRGNGTWYDPNWVKKPYRIKLDSATDFFGMGSEKDWIFLANYSDKTLLRTGIALHLSSKMNFPWTPDARFVELVLNGEYIGNYQLVEQIEQSNEKVNVSSSTGYILQLDNWYQREPRWFVTDFIRGSVFGYSFQHPDYEDLTQEQFTYIENYVNEFESVLVSDEFNDAETGYQKYIDLNSFARWFLFQNIIANLDPNIYITKHDNTANSKLYMGPVRDFDWSMGTGWYDGPRPRPPDYWVQRVWVYNRLIEDTTFICELQNLWNAHKTTLRQEVLDYISRTREEIYESQKLNFRRWVILDSPVGATPMGSFDAEVDCDVQFFINHYDWLDTAINEL